MKVNATPSTVCGRRTSVLSRGLGGPSSSSKLLFILGNVVVNGICSARRENLSGMPVHDVRSVASQRVADVPGLEIAIRSVEEDPTPLPFDRGIVNDY
jgi:hypothetical protein